MTLLRITDNMWLFADLLSPDSNDNRADYEEAILATGTYIK